MDTESISKTELTPSVLEEASVQITALQKNLERVIQGKREAIELHHIEELPFAEVAERMGRSKPSVAGLIFRGIRALRRNMKAMESGTEI